MIKALLCLLALTSCMKAEDTPAGNGTIDVTPVGHMTSYVETANVRLYERILRPDGSFFLVSRVTFDSFTRVATLVGWPTHDGAIDDSDYYPVTEICTYSQALTLEQAAPVSDAIYNVQLCHVTTHGAVGQTLEYHINGGSLTTYSSSALSPYRPTNDVTDICDYEDLRAVGIAAINQMDLSRPPSCTPNPPQPSLGVIFEPK